MQDRPDYVYVILDINGACWAVTDGGTKRIDGLPTLFRAGWRPIRETPFHISAGNPYMLILLEYVAEASTGSAGFLAKS